MEKPTGSDAKTNLFAQEKKMTMVKRARSEREDFIMNYTIRKDCEQRLKEREEAQKKASACVNHETLAPPTLPKIPPTMKGTVKLTR